jgi:putative ABC transport system permease protein
MTDTIRQNVRYALRLWKRRPAFAGVAILTLALGIGANTAMFSIVNAVLLRPLPYVHGDRIATIWARTATNPRSLLSWDEYQAIARQATTFDAAGVWLGQSVNLTGSSQPQRIVGNFVSGSFFDVLALGAERGRVFREDESIAGAAQPVVVVSHQFWEQQLSSDPEAIGRSITLNGSPLTVIGVLAPPFDSRTVPAGGWFIEYDVFIPVGLFPAPGGLAAAGPTLLGVARLKADTALASANANLDVVSRQLLAANPNAQIGRSMHALLAHDDLVGESRQPLMLLLACVAAVLLIACVNVSNLLLARAVDRQREIAVRSALGATRRAVLGQMFTEILLLAMAAAAVGLVLGRWLLRTVAWLQPPSVPIPPDVPLDATVLLFTSMAGVVVALACGGAPALRVSRADTSRALQAGSRRTSTTGGSTRDALVVVEVALSLAILAVSGLLVQSMIALQRVDSGFDPANVLTLQFRLPQAKYSRPADIARFFQQAIERVRSAPGIESAALVRRVPYSGNWGDTPFTIEGRPVAAGSEPRAGQNIVTPDYFRTMRIPLLQGRDFTDRDDLQSPPVAVINQTFARTMWPDQDPIGKRIKVSDFKESVTIVGVVGDVKHRTSTEPRQPQLYLAHYQLPMIFSSLVARTKAPPLTAAADVRRAIWSVDNDQPMWSVAALETLVARSHGSTRFVASLLAMFSALALLLAAVGTYGVMSYAVTERTHEIGIRMALGASAERVRREIVGRGLRLTAVAVIVGIAMGTAGGRAAKTLLFGVQPTDPSTLTAAAAILGSVAIAACYLPARRASRVDPVIALAEE